MNGAAFAPGASARRDRAGTPGRGVAAMGFESPSSGRGKSRAWPLVFYQRKASRIPFESGRFQSIRVETYRLQPTGTRFKQVLLERCEFRDRFALLSDELQITPLPLTQPFKAAHAIFGPTSAVRRPRGSDASLRSFVGIVFFPFSVSLEQSTLPQCRSGSRERQRWFPGCKCFGGTAAAHSLRRTIRHTRRLPKLRR